MKILWGTIIFTSNLYDWKLNYLSFYFSFIDSWIKFDGVPKEFLLQNNPKFTTKCINEALRAMDGECTD